MIVVNHSVIAGNKRLIFDGILERLDSPKDSSLEPGTEIRIHH